MNLIFFITILILLIFSVMGYKKGLIKTVISLLGVIIALLLSNVVYGQVSKFIQNDKVVANDIRAKITASVEKKLDSHVNSRTEQVLAIDKLSLPEDVKKMLVDNNNQDVYDELKVDSFSEYVANMLSCLVINGIAYLVTFLILTIFVMVLISMAKILTDFPLVGWIDSLGGLALGFGRGLLMVWIVYIFVTACSTTTWGLTAYRNIQDNILMKIIYDNNLLSNVLFNFAKTLF